MRLQAGDKVRFLNETTKGVVRSLLANSMVEVMTDEGFSVQVSASELVSEIRERIPLEHLEDESEWVKLIRQKEMHDKQRRSRRHINNRKEEAVEVDLHVGELLESKRGLSNGEILNMQVDHCRKKLNAAIRNKIRRIVFIHGVGEGVLKAALYELFRSYDNIDYFDASYQKYGRGATEVHIR